MEGKRVKTFFAHSVRKNVDWGPPIFRFTLRLWVRVNVLSSRFLVFLNALDSWFWQCFSETDHRSLSRSTWHYLVTLMKDFDSTVQQRSAVSHKVTLSFWLIAPRPNKFQFVYHHYSSQSRHQRSSHHRLPNDNSFRCEVCTQYGQNFIHLKIGKSVNIPRQIQLRIWTISVKTPSV